MNDEKRDERDLLEYETPLRLDVALPDRIAAGPHLRKCSHPECGKKSAALPADQLTVIKHHHDTQPKGHLRLYCAAHVPSVQDLGRTRGGTAVHRRNETCPTCGLAMSLTGECDNCA